MIVRVDYAKLSRELTTILELARNLPRCWHCRGTNSCNCIACARTVGVDVFPGPCAWCKTARRKIIEEHLAQLCQWYGVSEKLMQARIEACMKWKEEEDE